MGPPPARHPDDWWALPCAARQWGQPIEAYGGEPAAHVEAARRHGVVFECACGPCNASHSHFANGIGFTPFFVVKGFSPEGDSGFAADATQVDAFRRRQSTCRNYRGRRDFKPVSAKAARERI